MSDMTVEDALDYLDNVCVCHGCECWQDHDWGGCYRTTTTGKMACDLRDEAVEVLRKVVFRAMGATDMNVEDKERTAKLDHTYQVGENWYCENCGQQLNAYDWETPQNLAELGKENAHVSEVTSQNDGGTWQKTDRTAKAIEHDASVTDTDGYKYHRSEYLCGACKKKVLGGDEYCSHCGCRLDWNEDIPMEYFESGGI